jgi:hypothetical protein
MLPDKSKHKLDDPMTIALRALVWTLAAPDRADRMLALTGLEVDDLRARAGEPALLAAVLGFLEAYEPDLIACAQDLEIKPDALVAARAQLER